MFVKWRKYILLFVMTFCSVYADSMLLQDAIAQQTEQQGVTPRSDVEDLKWQLQLMEDAIAKQQEQMQAIRDRLDAVSAPAQPVAEDYHSAVAKEEIKHAIEDYLSTDEARGKMGLGLPVVTGIYTPDDEKYALGFKSKDDKYSLNLGARMQFRYTFKDNDPDYDGEHHESVVDTNNLDVRRARVYFGGNIYSELVHYYVELDGDSFNVGVRDFYIYVTPLEELNAKIGYFKVPFNRQRMASSAKLLLQDRSIASEAFDQDRDYGIDIYGKPFEGHIEYHASVFQGAGEKANENTDNELMYILSLRYNPFGKYDYYDETDVKYTDTLKATVGASAVFNAKDRDEKLKNTDSIAGVFDFGIKYKGISWNSEYFVRTEDPESDGDTINSDGFYTQLGYFVLPKKLEVATRYSQLDPNNDISNDFQEEYTIGVNYYFRAHRSKIQSDIGHYVNNDGVDGKDDNRIRLQYQIIF